MWELDHKESWTWRIDVFKVCCWRGLLWVHWTTRRSNQAIRKEISPEYSLEGLMLKLKLQYFGHLLRRTDLLEKTVMQERLKAWEEMDNKGWDDWMAWLTQWTGIWASSGSWRPTGKPGVLFANPCSSWVCKKLDMFAWLNWTELHFK